MSKRVTISLLLALSCAAAAQAQTSEPASTTVSPRIPWRAVAVAGDDSASVFDNGVQAVATILAAHGVAPIDRFTSDPDLTRPALPIATVAAMDAALTAARPQPGEGCLVFITSHGGRNGVLLRDDRDSRFVLEPAALARMLDRGCGDAPTVAIVSACFSGIFLGRAIETPNRIILTAARKDRTSFGCGHEEEFTYFDGCMIEAWPDSPTWQALFQATAACVRKKEDALHFQHSEPQAYFGAAVANLGLP